MHLSTNKKSYLENNFNVTKLKKKLFKHTGSHGRQNVVISRKRCKLEKWLLHTTNRKLHIANRFAALPLTFSDLQTHFI